ncbi:MAG TPA: hypothetical protein VGX25_06695 [Actinophytocola sp.]|uniref:hypothetical protein n=1 Tax=Actinophytocola sp. TaxID=1872138 RepID=UPI002DDD1B9A|nr:hypothetical protein [Actinophytocola sp.]HEV2779076.1 hypothetical protein [Actinophytocola sp.]
MRRGLVYGRLDRPPSPCIRSDRPTVGRGPRHPEPVGRAPPRPDLICAGDTRTGLWIAKPKGLNNF